MNMTDIRIVINGQTDLLIENYKGIAHYQEDCVVICGKNKRVRINGSHLIIDYYSKFDLHIKGNIESLVWTE